MTEGTICCGERCSDGTRSAMARAAASSISWVMCVDRTSMAPRKMPGNTRALVIRLGTSGRPVATTAAPAALAASGVISGSGTASTKRMGRSAKNGSGSRMLFGMQDGDVDGSRQVIGNGETAWRSDPTEADAAKGRPQRHTSTDDFLYILCVQGDGKGIHTPKGFEENAGVFEHRQGC